MQPISNSKNENQDLPGPTGTNKPVLRKTPSDSLFPNPLSPFGHGPLPLPWLEMSPGTLHLVLDPLLKPIPSFVRWLGHIVMVRKLSLLLNFAAHARHKISSTSSSGPVNL